MMISFVVLGFSLEPAYKVVVLNKAKQIKSTLNLVLNRELELFKLCDENTPEEYVELSLSLSSNITSEILEFEEDIVVQGKSVFKILAGTINVLQSTVHELREPKASDSPHVSLKEAENNLLTVFSSDSMTQFNETSISYDYLKSLFRYVKNLAGLQLYYETKPDTKETTAEGVRPLKVANPYVLFNERISTIFGRLLFDWKLPPKKLEVFAKQSGVNLIKVITENCGVTEVVTRTPPVSLLHQIVLMESKVLNQYSDSESSTDFTSEDDSKPASQVVEEILTNVLDMIAGMILFSQVKSYC